MFTVLSIFELVGLAIFFLAMLIGVAFDRRGTEEPKWFVLFFGAVVLGIVFWSHWSFSGIVDVVVTTEFWKNISFYITIGLGYSVLEFSLGVRRAARYYSEAWQKLLRDKYRRDSSDRGVIVGDLLKSATAEDASSEDKSAASSVIHDFIVRHHGCQPFISARKVGDTLSVEPYVNRQNLAEHIGAWTVFWPFYAISLIFGDLLTEIFQSISNFIATISTRIVKLAFSNSFKI